MCAALLCGHATGCEAYSLTTDGCGVLNVRTQWDACVAHSGGRGQAQTSPAQELTRRDRNTARQPAPPGYPTNHWATGPLSCTPRVTCVSYHSRQFSSIPFSSVQLDSVQLGSVQFYSFQFRIQFSSVLFSLVQLNSVQFS